MTGRYLSTMRSDGRPRVSEWYRGSACGTPERRGPCRGLVLMPQYELFYDLAGRKAKARLVYPWTRGVVVGPLVVTIGTLATELISAGWYSLR